MDITIVQIIINLEATKPSEIVKCKSRNGPQYWMDWLYLTEVLTDIFIYLTLS